MINRCVCILWLPAKSDVLRDVGADNVFSIALETRKHCSIWATGGSCTQRTVWTRHSTLSSNRTWQVRDLQSRSVVPRNAWRERRGRQEGRLLATTACYVTHCLFPAFALRLLSARCELIAMYARPSLPFLRLKHSQQNYSVHVVVNYFVLVTLECTHTCCGESSDVEPSSQLPLCN